MVYLRKIIYPDFRVSGDAEDSAGFTDIEDSKNETKRE